MNIYTRLAFFESHRRSHWQSKIELLHNMQTIDRYIHLDEADLGNIRIRKIDFKDGVNDAAKFLTGEVLEVTH